MFTDEQKKALAAPLLRTHVKERNQAGRSLSYIESWVAISEANRIFGFDGWNRETVEIKCVSERERTIRNEKGWGVSYVGKVRVTVGSVVREGCGAGHGIDRDLGLAHESALKEMESDAAKRALMTFGNPFGLALYDKSQENVVDGPVETGEIVSDDQRDRILELIAQTNSNVEAFCKYMGIADISAMPADIYQKAIGSLEHKLKRGK